MADQNARSIARTITEQLKKDEGFEDVKYEQHDPDRVIGRVVLGDQPDVRFAVNTNDGTFPGAWIAQGYVQNHIESDVVSSVAADVHQLMSSRPDKPSTI